MKVRGCYEFPPASGGPETGGSLSDEYSELEPPDPIPNSEVKRLSADGSVGSPHVRVGHRQAFMTNASMPSIGAFFFAHECVENISNFRE